MREKAKKKNRINYNNNSYQLNWNYTSFMLYRKQSFTYLLYRISFSTRVGQTHTTKKKNISIILLISMKKQKSEYIFFAFQRHQSKHCNLTEQKIINATKWHRSQSNVTR